MALIPEHIIDRVRDSVNIVDVIERYVSLKKAGKNYKGLCPFHKEKTPSFMVNPEKQIFRCFGCGIGGNVFYFLTEYEKISFVDAVKRLAEENGIAIPTSPENRRQESENEKLIRANQFAGDFFVRQLQKAPEDVKQYLTTRGISGKIQKLLKIGYAPEGWSNLVREVKKQKLPVDSFKKAGLILESEKDPSRLYDRFRGRLIFPIHNASGKIVAFGARQLSSEDTGPKYLNSPESPVYQKSQILYGLFFSKDFIREAQYAIFVEGYMDFLQLFQAGIKNIVATSGTALTAAHAHLIRRYTNKIVLCYDADNAGIQAAIRGGEILFLNNLDVDVLILPEDEDPDSYVTKNGREAFFNLLKEADDYFTFRLKQLQKSKNLEIATDRSHAVDEILNTLSQLQDTVRMGFYVERIADLWKIPSTLLMNELNKKIKNRRKKESLGFRTETDETELPEISTLKFSGAWSAERDIIVLLMNNYESISGFVFKYLDEDDFINPEFRDIIRMIRKEGENSPQKLLHSILDKIEKREIKNIIAENLFTDFNNAPRYLFDCIKKIQIARHHANMDVLQGRLKTVNRDDSEYQDIFRKLHSEMMELQKWQTLEPGTIPEK